MSLLIVDVMGMSSKIAEFNTAAMTMPSTINAPESNVEVDAPTMLRGSGNMGVNSEAPEVVGLTKNGDGDVGVTFGEPVTSIANIGL